MFININQLNQFHVLYNQKGLQVMLQQWNKHNSNIFGLEIK
jgi:hypothetical protein